MSDASPLITVWLSAPFEGIDPSNGEALPRRYFRRRDGGAAPPTSRRYHRPAGPTGPDRTRQT